MCKRKAERNGVGLGDHFWNSEEHKIEFQGQIVSARKLLKKYKLESVIEYLNGNGKNVFSLGHYTPLKFVITGIEIEEKKLKKLAEQMPLFDNAPISVPESVNKKPQKQFKKKNSLLSKLKKVDNNGEG